MDPTPPTPAPTKGAVTTLLTSQPAVYAFVITLVGLIGAVVLVAMSKTVPQELWGITGGAGLVGGGALVPRSV